DSGLCATFPGKQIRGFLTEMECTGSGVTFYVLVEGKTLRFQASDLSKIKVTNCSADGGEKMKCGALDTPRLVTVFYQQSDSTKPGIEGEPTGVVFMQNQ